MKIKGYDIFIREPGTHLPVGTVLEWTTEKFLARRLDRASDEFGFLKVAARRADVDLPSAAQLLREAVRAVGYDPQKWVLRFSNGVSQTVAWSKGLKSHLFLGRRGSIRVFSRQPRIEVTLLTYRILEDGSAVGVRAFTPHDEADCESEDMGTVVWVGPGARALPDDEVV